MSSASKQSFDVAVVGGGPAGLVAALSTAKAGAETILFAGPRPADNRTTALLQGSVAALDSLGVWEACAPSASPLRAIRLIDDLGGLLRAPEVLFRADEIGLDAFGQNTENRRLVAALTQTAMSCDGLTLREQNVATVAFRESDAAMTLADDPEILAKLVVGADGRNSLCRRTAGIALDQHAYPQAAVSCTLAHTRPHDNISTEFHTRAGPFTLVPLSGQRSSLVWVVAPERAEALLVLTPEAFAREAERQARSILGKMQLEGDRIVFPLTAQTAHALAAPRLVLVGEAAHILPPIGAQGFNLGLRDAVAVGERVAQAIAEGRDVGAAAVTDAYEQARRGDVTARGLATDLLNRSLLNDFLPVQAVRGLSLSLVNRIGPLRRALMRQGVGGASA